MIRVTAAFDIPDDELEERFVRSSGPGGQNVNKVSTAVELRWNAAGTVGLSHAAFARLRILAGRRMTSDGTLIIQADQFRTQEMNRSDARKRLTDLVSEALVVPKARIKTRPGRAAKERRIKAKTERGGVKAMRRAPRGDD